MPAQFSFRCLLCPNTYSHETGTGDSTNFDTPEDARIHLVVYHHIAAWWLRGAQIVRGPSGTLGETTVGTFRWELPSGAEVMETTHAHTLGDISVDDSALG